MHSWTNFRDIFFSSANVGYACGAAEIIKTTDGGRNWTEVCNRTLSFVSLSFCTDSMGIVVGDGGTILRTTNGGSTWIQVAPSSSVNETLLSVVALSADVALAGGYEGTIAKTTNGGLTWRTIPSATDKYVTALCMLNSSLGWASCGYATLMKTTDGGETWLLLTTGGVYPFPDISFRNSSTGYMLYKEPSETFFMKSSNGGTSWTTLLSFPNESYWTMFQMDNDTLYIAGNKIKKSTNGGLAWSEKLASAGTILRDIYFRTPSEGWAVGDGGVILHSSDFGNTWAPQASGTTEYLTGIACAGSNRIWVSGYSGTILFSTNSGQQWTRQVSHCSGKIWSLAFADEGRGWAVGDGGYILRTLNGGIVAGVDDDVVTRDLRPFHLYQNYPNPFNPVTSIRFSIAKAQRTTLKVFDLTGREIASLLNEHLQPGNHTVQWNAQGHASGVYMVRLECNGYAATRKIVLVK